MTWGDGEDNDINTDHDDDDNELIKMMMVMFGSELLERVARTFWLDQV